MRSFLQKNILVTGPPGCGKTTFIRKLAGELRDLEPAGFFTGEMREGGRRTGFGLTSFSGMTGVLAHVGIGGTHRVGSYGVDIAGFERFLGSLAPSDDTRRLFIIDEIGRMECLSPRFRKLMTTLLDSAVPVVATIALRGGGFLSEVKSRQDVVVVELSLKNRNALLPEIAGRVRGLM